MRGKLRRRPERPDNGISPALMMRSVTSVNKSRPLGKNLHGRKQRKEVISPSHDGRRAKTDARMEKAKYAAGTLFLGRRSYRLKDHASSEQTGLLTVQAQCHCSSDVSSCNICVPQIARHASLSGECSGEEEAARLSFSLPSSLGFPRAATVKFCFGRITFLSGEK